MLTLLVGLALAQSVPLAERHQQWLEEEVHFLLSQREKESFLALDNEAARDRFILDFWHRRDPTPGTSRNEFRDRHYVRLEAADRLFTLVETSRGRFTDRGRAYQLLGEPQSRVDFSHAGDRLFPLELWQYVGRTEEFLPDSFYLIYFRDGGGGDYRLWSPVSDGVQALVPDPEPGRFLLDEGGAYDELGRVDMELARAARSLISGDEGSGPFSSESLRLNIESYADMADRYLALDAEVRASTGFRELGVASTSAVLYDATGIPQVHYALEVPLAKIAWREEGERSRASFGIACRMMDSQGRHVDAIEDWIDLDWSEEERGSREGGALSFQGRLILPPGHYVLHFTLVSIPAATHDALSLTVNVPDSSSESDGSGGALSPILLARSRQALGGGRFADRLPFQVGEFILNPSPNAVFPATEALAYVQLSGDHEGATLDWSLAANDERANVIWTGKSDVRSASAGVVSIERIVPLGNLPEGDYTLRVELLGERREARLTVDRAVVPPSVRVLSRESLAAGDGRILFRRGLLFTRLGDAENAIGDLTAALRLRPRDLEIGLKLALLLYAAERYEEVIASLQPLAPHYPNESDVFVLLGFAALQIGDAGKAVSYLEGALALRPDDERLATALVRARGRSGSSPAQ